MASQTNYGSAAQSHNSAPALPNGPPVTATPRSRLANWWCQLSLWAVVWLWLALTMFSFGSRFPVHLQGASVANDDDGANPSHGQSGGVPDSPSDVAIWGGSINDWLARETGVNGLALVLAVTTAWGVYKTTSLPWRGPPELAMWTMGSPLLGVLLLDATMARINESSWLALFADLFGYTFLILALYLASLLYPRSTTSHAANGIVNRNGLPRAAPLFWATTVGLVCCLIGEILLTVVYEVTHGGSCSLAHVAHAALEEVLLIEVLHFAVDPQPHGTSSLHAAVTHMQAVVQAAQASTKAADVPVGTKQALTRVNDAWEGVLLLTGVAVIPSPAQNARGATKVCHPTSGKVSKPFIVSVLFYVAELVTMWARFLTGSVRGISIGRNASSKGASSKFDWLVIAQAIINVVWAVIMIMWWAGVDRETRNSTTTRAGDGSGSGSGSGAGAGDGAGAAGGGGWSAFHRAWRTSTRTGAADAVLLFVPFGALLLLSLYAFLALGSPGLHIVQLFLDGCGYGTMVLCYLAIAHCLREDKHCMSTEARWLLAFMHVLFAASLSIIFLVAKAHDVGSCDQILVLETVAEGVVMFELLHFAIHKMNLRVTLVQTLWENSTSDDPKMTRGAHVVNGILCAVTVVVFCFCALATDRRPYLALAACFFSAMGSIMNAFEARSRRWFALAAAAALVQTLLAGLRSSSALIPLGPGDATGMAALTGWYGIMLASLAMLLLAAIYSVPLVKGISFHRCCCWLSAPGVIVAQGGV